MKRKVPKKADRQASPEEVGKMLVSIYESGYLDHTTAYKMSFIKGVLAGLGGVIGATIVVALLMWGLSLFSSVPFIGRIAENVTNTIENSTKYQEQYPAQQQPTQQ